MVQIPKIKLKKWYFIVIAAAVLIVLPVGLYLYGPLGKLTYGLFRYLPYPVAVVGGNQVITTRELIADTRALKTFYVSQDFSSAGMRVDFDTEEGQMRLKVKEKDVFDKLVENEVIKELALARGIKISQQDAEREINKRVNQMGNRNALEMNLKKLYGWDADDFRDKVVIPQLYTTKLAEDFFKNERTKSEGYDKISKAKKELKADGSNFKDIAVKYSDGESAKNGGELGWFTQEQMVPEVGNAVFAAKEGTVTDIIQSSLGYHIVMVQEFRDRTENQSGNGDVLDDQSAKIREVKVKQVFVKDGGFLEWLKAEKQKAKVWVMMKDYTWNAEQARVMFRDERLNKAEETLRAKSQGDPSMQ